MDWNLETYNAIKDKIENNSFLYIIYSEYGCKIGFTKSPLERKEQIRQGLPSQECSFIGLYAGDNSLVFETRLHNKFKTQKISGEWFILNDEDLEFVDNYLSKNGFKCLIRKSIYWANYLNPSIYVKGKVKVIEKVNHSNQKSKRDIEVPQFFTDIVLRPENDNIFDTNVKFMTPKDISEQLKLIGFKCEPETVGKYLTSLNFKRVSKRLTGIGPRKGYYVILNINVP